MDRITIENNIIENNGATGSTLQGGGISFGGSNITIKNNTIRNNKAGKGAAIARTDKMTNFLIEGNRIENNLGYSDHGGGVDVHGTGTITKNIFTGNRIGEGITWGWGGAILISNENNPSNVITLSYNTYSNNQAPSRGGAVFVDDEANVKMDHELFYNNKSKESGSAIYVDVTGGKKQSVLEMTNCTVSGNSSTDNSAALFVQGSKVTIQNCIFWNNGKDFETINDGATAVLTVTYTLTQQGYTGTGNISSNPLFANAASGDFHLQSKGGRYNNGQWVIDATHSPAIDAGNPSTAFSNEPMPNGGRVNLGRYGNTNEASKSGSTGIEDITQISWTIYPNPAKESITIGPLPIGSSVTIFNITGKNVYSSPINNEQTTISTANFANGIYIIQVTNNSAVAARKLIVSK